MNSKVLLVLAAVAVSPQTECSDPVAATCVAGGTVKRVTQECEQYPYGWGYRNMGRVFTIATNCLSAIKVTSSDCAYAAVEGVIRASEHERYANSDLRKTVSFVSACLKNSNAATAASIDKVEACLIKGLSPY